MPTAASSPRRQIEIAALVMVLAGTGLCATAAIDAKEHGHPLGDVHLLFGGVAVAFGLSMLATLLVGRVLDRRSRRRLTLQAGRARKLVSMSQAAHFLRL